jgi:hypothetical protein
MNAGTLVIARQQAEKVDQAILARAFRGGVVGIDLCVDPGQTHGSAPTCDATVNDAAVQVARQRAERVRLACGELCALVEG